MKRVHSELFAPYRTLGVVASNVPPSVRSTFVGKTSMLSVVCPVDNVLMHYNGKKLRLIGVSNAMDSKITAVASSSSCIFAAHGRRISALPFCRDVTDSLDIDSNIRIMITIGTNLIAIDGSSAIHVIDTTSTLQQKLLMEGESSFSITAVVHPSTYLNKIIIGSDAGQLRIVNIRTGKVVHEFERSFGSPITVLEQTTALDVMAIGLESGEVILHNVKLDKVLHVFRHDSSITSIAFRNDGDAMMVTSDVKGTLAVWNLDNQELLGKITKTHSDAVNCLHFIPGEPIMLSASSDNSLRLWIFDGADGMPRELVQLDGHSLPPSLVQFCTKTELLSAEINGSMRKYDVSSLTMRQKLGSVASREASGNQEETEIAEIVVGWQKGEAWNNVFCRQRNDTIISTWHSRNNSKGALTLQHERFKKNVNLVSARATALCLSPCGNFVFVGYSSGHIDQFNTQSGRHVHAFSVHERSKKSIAKNMSAKNKYDIEIKSEMSEEMKITSLSIDRRGKELLGAVEAGSMIFWSLDTRKVVAKLVNKAVRLGKSFPSPSNSLIAIVAVSDKGKESVALVDMVCHQVVRSFENVGGKVNSIVFSSDGKWLLIADNQSYIRVFDVSTSHMIDVLLFSKPCISMSFNETGEFLATVHEGERAVYVWINKAMFLSHVNVRALDEDFIPTWGSRKSEPDVCIDDDDDVIHDEEVRAVRESQIDQSLITFSGLPPSRWANLPDLALIKQRNKPINSLKKVKQAPFFLSTTATIDGFQFQSEDSSDLNLDLNNTGDKRSLLEMESEFSVLLSKAKSSGDLLKAFVFLQDMSLSSIDFHIRTLSTNSVSAFLRMLQEVLKTKKDFELVQSYLVSFIKAQRLCLWEGTLPNKEETYYVLSELLQLQDDSWNDMEELFVENMSIVQWIKNALL